MVYAVEVNERTIPQALRGLPFRSQWRYYRFRWAARFVVWWINTLGAGREYEYARGPWETL